VNCLDFRRRVGAEPFNTDAEIGAHRQQCAACARHQDALQQMDRLLARAMQVEWPRRTLPVAGVSQRWQALAASLAAAVLFAGMLWVSYPRPTLAAEVIDHALHEPASWSTTSPLSGEAVARVLSPDGIRLRGGAAKVSYAKRCFFDGHWVPHLVVQTDDGPVTVLLLEHRKVSQVTRIEQRGMVADVLPAAHGSIAVIGRHAAGLDAIAKAVSASLEWDS
jgi:hypothetical protein